MSVAKEGSVVKVHYKGTLKDGSVFDSSQDRDPLEFTVGAGQMIAGFDAGVVGMAVGEKKTIEIACEEAYGPHREEMIAKVPAKDVPEDINPKVGMALQMQHPNGMPITVTIIEVTDEHILLDGNPPLAGKDLIFEIDMVEVKNEASSD